MCVTEDFVSYYTYQLEFSSYCTKLNNTITLQQALRVFMNYVHSLIKISYFSISLSLKAVWTSSETANHYSKSWYIVYRPTGNRIPYLVVTKIFGFVTFPLALFLLKFWGLVTYISELPVVKYMGWIIYMSTSWELFLIDHSRSQVKCILYGFHL